MLPAEPFLDPANAEFWIRVGAGLACGGAIGLERQVRGKPAGMRTSVLVCLGTVFFVQLGAALGGPNDPTRVLGQVVTGIGFLGAGVILSRDGIVVGVTSASVVWLLAAIGAAIGLGYLPAAFAVTVVALLVLVGMEYLERSFNWLRQGVHSRIGRDGESR